MSDILTTWETIAEAKGCYSDVLPDDSLIEVRHVPTIEYGKRAKPVAPELEFHWRVLALGWEGWRDVYDRNQVRRLINGEITASDWLEEQIETALRMLDRVQETRAALRRLG